MATTTESSHDTGHPADDAEHDHHPSDRQYWVVGIILGVITALEVSTYFITDDPYSHDLKPLLIGSLLVMMTAKFIAIGAYFMHLKFDSKLLRNVFITGIVLALIVYAIVFFTFSYFDDSYEAGLALLR